MHLTIKVVSMFFLLCSQNYFDVKLEFFCTGSRIKFMRGILITVESTMMLHDQLLHQLGISYLKGQNILQDYLEAFFGEMRGMTGSCTHPTALQFLYTLSRKIGSVLAADPSFDLLGKRLELEKSLQVEPMPDTDFGEIEKTLVNYDPSKMSQAEHDGFYMIAASVAQKFSLTHPELGKEKEISSSTHFQFSNTFSKG